MKNRHFMSFALLASVFFQAFSPANAQSPVSASTAAAVVDAEIFAIGTAGRRGAAPPQPLFQGDGGANTRLAILAPEVHGDVPVHLPIYVQGLLNNNFGRYSAVKLFDRQALNRILSEQKIPSGETFTGEDFIKIGNSASVRYLLTGTIQKFAGEWYSLRLSVIEFNTGDSIANFTKVGTLAQFEGRVSIVNEATADLLGQMGVQLTETGKLNLLARNIPAQTAELELARGITAQALGLEMDALFNYTQATAFDPSQSEAAARLNALASTIRSGTITQRTLDDRQKRELWLAAFRDTTRFFNNHPPFEIIYDPNLVQMAQTDSTRRTSDLVMRIVLDSSQAGFAALNTVLEGIEKTGRREEWGFFGWPLMNITPRSMDTMVFGGKRSFSFNVEVTLRNENNKVLGNSSVALNTFEINFSAGDAKITPPGYVFGIVNFSNIRTEDITPTLTIVITAVNGISAAKLNSSGYMKIETGDLEERMRLYDMAKRQAEIKALETAAVDRQRYAAARNTANERKKAVARRALAGIYGFAQFTDDGRAGGGAEIDGFLPVVPYLSLGLEARFGTFDDKASAKAAKDKNEVKTITDYVFLVAPVLGVIYPFNTNVKIFADGLLEMGSLGYGLKGMAADWVTPAVDAGFLFDLEALSVIVKYRCSFYADVNTHSVSLGISMW